MPKLSDAMLKKIQQEAENIPYGKITINLNETCKEVTVAIEKQERFLRDDKESFRVTSSGMRNG